MRREFSKPVKREALKRADKKCEGTLANGSRCGALLGMRFAFDHDIADGLGGEPTLENCKVLCHVCHGEKTAKHDIPLIAKVKRISDKHNGIRTPKQKIASRGFEKRPPQYTASRPLERN